jgi:parallel beta-helix repeat protein
MKKKLYLKELVIGIVILFIGAGSTPTIAIEEMKNTSLSSSMVGNTWYVSEFGNDSNNGTSWSTAWLTIRHAIQNSYVGDNITVGNGTYRENIVIDKQLNIKGNSSSNTTINGSFTGNVIEIDESASGVNISGFNITNSGNNKINAGISIESSKNNITHNIISLNGYAGISIVGHDNRIEGNVITLNLKEGIKIFGDGNIIENNTITNNGFNKSNEPPAGNGIRIMEETHNTYIIHNEITHNFNDGIHVTMCNGLFIVNNTISNGTEGFSGAIAFFLVENIYCVDNTIFNNTHGIYFSETRNVLCEGNNIYNNTRGIETILLVPLMFNNGVFGNNTIRYNIINHNEINIYMISSFFFGFGIFSKGNNILTRNKIVNATKWAVKAEFSFAYIPLNYWGGILAGGPYLTWRNHINRIALSLVIVNPCLPPSGGLTIR